MKDAKLISYFLDLGLDELEHMTLYVHDKMQEITSVDPHGDLSMFYAERAGALTGLLRFIVAVNKSSCEQLRIVQDNIKTQENE